MTDGRYLTQEFLEDCIGCSQPPTDQLPSITNHYTFIRFKKDYVHAVHSRLQASIPRNLLPRVQRIIKSMVDMDIIEPTDHATNTMPVTFWCWAKHQRERLPPLASPLMRGNATRPWSTICQRRSPRRSPT
jgi:hypothetical protein